MKTVSANYFLSALQACVSEGCDRDALLSGVKVSPAQIAVATNRLPASAHLKLLHLAETHLGRTGIGIPIGESFRPQTFLDIGYGAMYCANIFEALKFNRRYQKLTQEIGTTDIHVNGDHAAIVWSPFSEDHELVRPVTDSVFAGYFMLGTWMAWLSIDSVQAVVEFKHDETAYANRFREAFHCEVIFNAPRNAVVFPSQIALTPFPQHNPALLKTLSAKLSRQLFALESQSSISDRVANIIDVLLPSDGFSIVDVARQIGISERTLRRQLSQEGTSYRELLEKTRKEACEIHMRDPNISLADIAQMLGYSDQSAFHTAFTAWHGKTPSVYRSDVIESLS